jgi:hypothetical protein
LDKEIELWDLATDDLNKLHRTAGYMLSLNHAMALRELATDSLYIVDDYSYIASHTDLNRFFLCNCIGHPIDLTRSAIESERTMDRLTMKEDSGPLLRRLRRELLATIAARKDQRRYERRTSGIGRIEWTSRFTSHTPESDGFERINMKP